MNKKEWKKRLKKLEAERYKELDTPVVFIDILENGQREIYTFIKGEERLLTEEEWQNCSPETVTIIDDIPDTDF